MGIILNISYRVCPMTQQKILIVDDSELIRVMIKDMLPGDRFEILEAQDGAEGFALIYAERPHLVLMDFFMPNMNGWEVLYKVQGYPELNRIPVVMMSSRPDDVEDLLPGLLSHFEFLRKPFDQPALFRSIKLSMEKAKQRKEGVVMKQPKAGEAASEAIEALKTEMQQLRQDNAILRTDLEGLKQRLERLTTLVTQRLG